MKFLQIILFLLFTTINYNSFSTNVKDSILEDLFRHSQTKQDPLILNELSKHFTETNLDSALYYANQGYILAIQTDHELGIAENSASIADCYVMLDSLNKAKKYYLQSNKYFSILEMDYDQAKVLMVIGNIYLSQNNYPSALQYYQESQVICDANNYNTISAHLNNNIGIIYIQLGKKEKALSFLKKAFYGFKEADLQVNIAHAVRNIADIYISQDQDSSAIKYYNEALKIFQDSNNHIDASTVYISLGDYEYSQNNYQQALIYYEKALSQINNSTTAYLGPKSFILVKILAHLGRVHRILGDQDRAKKHLTKALNLAYQNHYNHWIEFCTLELSKLYEEKGDDTKALFYYKSYEKYGDSILNNSSIRKITQLEMQFEFDKREKEKELQDAKKEATQQKKELLYLIFIGLGVFIAIIAILLYLNQRSKTTQIILKRNNLKLEHDNLQQELNHRNKELATNVMYLLSKNEFITTTAEKLSKAQLNFKQENQKLIQDIIRDLLMNSSKNVWKEFEIRFQEVHSDFYNNINSKYPDLTPNEKKICAFLRLNMTTKDISAITYQSVKSINMARFRLRKKLGIDSDENLISVLAKM